MRAVCSCVVVTRWVGAGTARAVSDHSGWKATGSHCPSPPSALLHAGTFLCVGFFTAAVWCVPALRVPLVHSLINHFRQTRKKEPKKISISGSHPALGRGGKRGGIHVYEASAGRGGKCTGVRGQHARGKAHDERTAASFPCDRAQSTSPSARKA